MLNNSGAYGPDEAPPNLVASLNRQQSNTSNLTHNFHDFGKFVQRTASPGSDYYEAHNFHNFGQLSANAPPILHPFQAYQSMGHGSSYLPQSTQFSYENPIQNYYPAVSTHIKTEDEIDIANFNQNFHTKPISEIDTTEKESYISKGYPLNIPQVSSKIFQKSSKMSKHTLNDQPVTDNSSTMVEGTHMNTRKSQRIPTTENSIFHSITSVSSNSGISDTNSQEPLSNTNEIISTPEDLSETSPKIQRTTYNIVKNNNFSRNSIYEKCLTESKRKSLEKTVRLIETILINSNNIKPEEIETSVDPLGFIPNAEVDNTNSEDNSQNVDSGSDDEALIKKLPVKNKRKQPAKKSQLKKVETMHSFTESSTEIESQLVNIKVEDIKIEPLSWPDVEYGNPFHKDCNGVIRSSVGDSNIIDLDSEKEALEIIKNGLTTNTYFECPHCSLLLQHPKRFLIHTKWHMFGLLNKKRAEIMKEREDRAKEKREARSIQRLSAYLATGEETDTTFPCKDCDKIFQTKTSLKNHRRKSHPIEVTECRICLAPVRDMTELRAHMTTHEAAGLHQCPRCPKRFKYRHSLAKHADTHREKTHSCSECGKLFGSSALVRLHMKTHERAARGITHRCAYCGKGFYEAYNLQVHERTHRNDKAYKCEICESSFFTNSSLKRHVKVSHSGAKPYLCQVCQKCFASAAIRDRHELRIHSDQQQFPYQCRLCPRRYMKPKDLRNHTYKMHPKEKKKSVTSDTEQNSS